MKKNNTTPMIGFIALGLLAPVVSAQNNNQITQETIDRLEKRITELEQNIEVMAEELEHNYSASKKSDSQLHIGGYGELHYNHLDQDGEDIREIDFHRLVMFFGYQFSDSIRFISELEVEHSLVSSGSRGAVEVEQAYLEFDLLKSAQVRTGIQLMPLGIISETHEPPTFYGVERPIIETTIIPTTWYSAGISWVHAIDNGISYNLMLSEGLKTEDPNSDPNADPFDLKAGKQKASFADAHALAITGRIAYRGAKGLELSVYAQYQPDLDQKAEVSYAEDATLVGGHVVYQMGDFTGKALYARWDLAGDAAVEADKDVQDGGYLELGWKPAESWGVFVRQSSWSQQNGVEAEQSKVGVNYYPHPDVVIKADIQVQNEDAGNSDGFNLGVGYQF
ncbi:porin [Teredinibacter sp. KSP-S5-2]|uniref:porin n=1 Tax=Teredinibacter sp. KSP-S5-2 TaxID=3034506 RepID=UPI0029349CF1|nr:porin [Teredinibacter sp. KSP-S5-2]WNO10642.1 porin [Teredinibacter sp. KSP-S5-2]